MSQPDGCRERRWHLRPGSLPPAARRKVTASAARTCVSNASSRRYVYFFLLGIVGFEPFTKIPPQFIASM